MAGEGWAAWNGLAMLDWHVVAAKVNPLSSPLSELDCQAPEQASEEQLRQLAERVPLIVALLLRHDNSQSQVHALFPTPVGSYSGFAQQMRFRRSSLV